MKTIPEELIQEEIKELQRNTEAIKELVALSKPDVSQECKCHCHFDYPEACTGLHPMECEHCKPLKEKDEWECEHDLPLRLCSACITGGCCRPTKEDCQPPSPIKGECKCCCHLEANHAHVSSGCGICEHCEERKHKWYVENGFSCPHCMRKAMFPDTSPQPQSEDSWEKDIEWLLSERIKVKEKTFTKRETVKNFIKDLLKSQRESYQKEIVGIVKAKRDTYRDCIEYRLLDDLLAILEQEKE